MGTDTGYLDGANFSKRHNHENFLEHIEKEKEHNRQQPFVQHHNEKYSGQFPIWVIIELFSMGELSLFYADMKRADQKCIAKLFSAPSDTHMRSWLKNIEKFLRPLFQAIRRESPRRSQNA